jgi:hypothetical protein
MFSVAGGEGLVHVGLDVAKNSIVVGVLGPGQEVPGTQRIGSDERSVHRLVDHLVDRFGDRSLLRCCYEAGPTGYGLYRQLRGLGVFVRWWRRRWCRGCRGIGSRPISGIPSG